MTVKNGMTFGVIVGNRGFFPDHLAKSGRDDVMRVLQAAGTDVVVLTPEESKYGAVETREESHRCAELFRKNRDRINGIIVTLPNFGEEAGDRGHAALGGPSRAGTCAGYSRRPQQDGHRQPARQLLRENVGLQ